MPAVYCCESAFLRFGSTAGGVFWPETFCSALGGRLATYAGVIGKVPFHIYLKLRTATGLRLLTNPVPTFSEKRPQLALSAVFVFPNTSHAMEKRGTKLWNAVMSRLG